MSTTPVPLTHAPTARITAEEFLARYGHIDGAELVNGVVRLPDREAESEAPTDGPALVVLIRSPGELLTHFYAQIAQHLATGARTVLLLDKVSAAVGVYHNDQPPRTLRGGDALTLPDVLPGFSVPVARLFA